jgi:hypothetical protein
VVGLLLLAPPTGAAPQSSTATISGVVRDEAARPVAFATVTVAHLDVAATSSVTTDEAGRFTLPAIQAGRLRISASKAGHLTTIYGASRRGGPAPPLVVSPGETVADIEFTLPRGASISGVVRDVTGDPAPGVEVTIFLVREDPLADPIQTRTTVTDARGQYRVFGLEPGHYVIGAVGRDVGSRGIVRMTTDRIDAVLAGLKRRRSSRDSGFPEYDRRASALVPTYHPAVAEFAAAQRVAVQLGDNRSNVDVDLQVVRTGNIRGVIRTMNGEAPPDIALTLVPAGGGLSEDLGAVFRVLPPDREGRFSIVNVPPGQYVLTATSRPRAGTSRAAVTSWARAEITAYGTDIDGVALSMRPALHVRGRIVTLAQGLTSEAKDKPLNVTLTEGARSRVAVAVAADGSFEITGLMPGKYHLAIGGLPAGWRARSALWQGRDLLDLGLDLTDESADDVIVSVTNRRASLAGTLMVNDRPAPSYVLVLFPVEPDLWAAIRRLHAARSGRDGQYLFEDVPEGAYRLAAVTEIEAAVWRTRDFLEALVPHSVTVSLEEGRETRRDFRIGR